MDRCYGVIVTRLLRAISALEIGALMSFTVAARKRGLGVRIALGAGWPDVVATIAKRALVHLGLGAPVGMRTSAGMLYVLTIEFARVPMESPVLVASLVTVGVVILIATLACVAPTLRALRISPTEALREGG